MTCAVTTISYNRPQIGCGCNGFVLWGLFNQEFDAMQTGARHPIILACGHAKKRARMAAKTTSNAAACPLHSRWRPVAGPVAIRSRPER